MILTIIERFDLNLLILVLVYGFFVAYLDGKYFKRENKVRARNQCLYIGIGSSLFTLIMYIIRIIVI